MSQCMLHRLNLYVSMMVSDINGSLIATCTYGFSMPPTGQLLIGNLVVRENQTCVRTTTISFGGCLGDDQLLTSNSDWFVTKYPQIGKMITWCGPKPIPILKQNRIVFCHMIHPNDPKQAFLFYSSLSQCTYCPFSVMVPHFLRQPMSCLDNQNLDLFAAQNPDKFALLNNSFLLKVFNLYIFQT